MPRVRVRLHTERVQLEFRGDEALFRRVIEPVILNVAGRSAPKRGAGGAGVSGVGAPATTAGAVPAAKPTTASARTGYTPPSQDFGTFCRRLEPDENGEANRIAAFAFFLWNYERKEVFQEEEVVGCFRAEGADPPRDGASLYEELVARRILRPAESSGTWRLTTKGRAHVRHHLLSA